MLRQRVKAAFSAGIDYVQIRERDMPARSLAGLVENLAGCPEKRDSRLLVNERWDVAASCGAEGVHLPSDSVPLSLLRRQTGETMHLGVSCHCEEEVAQAVQSRASYVLLGPIFPTPSKPGARPLGLAALQAICQRFPIPIYALGGINIHNAPECIRAGAAGIAAIRLFQQAQDLGDLCRRIKAIASAR